MQDTSIALIRGCFHLKATVRQTIVSWCGFLLDTLMKLTTIPLVEIALTPSSTCSRFGRRQVRSPCVHALLLMSMRSRQTHASPTKTTEVEIGL